MKTRFSFLLITTFQVLAANLTGQTLYTKTDSILIEQDTIIKLRVPNHRGNTQWQNSIDGNTWTNIAGKTSDSLLVKPDNEATYRAVIIEGTCQPIFSGTAGIAFNKPSLSTDSIKNITQITALGGGQIVSSGGTSVFVRGLCWNTTGSPTIADNKTTNGTGKGTFKSSLTGLKANTRYYVRAYGTNAKGTGYGAQKSFTTSASGSPTGTFTDSRDGKNYKWVQIGTQVWMAENLAWLPSVNPPDYQSNKDPCYYVLGYKGTSVSTAKVNSNYTNYGVLYNWPAAMAGVQSSNFIPSGVQGVCPQGWHLPSEGEWSFLSDYLISNGYGYEGSGEDIAKALAATTNWVADTTSGVPGKNPANNNITGFSALPGGVLGYGTFSEVGYIAAWWTSTGLQGFGWYRDLTYIYTGLIRYLQENYYGFSVRCIRNSGTDLSNEAPNLPFNPSPVNNASVIPLKPVMTWDACDPEGDPMKYDIYLGTSAGSVSLTSSNQAGKSWSPSANLSAATDYFWKIVSSDDKGLATEGPVWKFTTTAGTSGGTFTDTRDGKIYKWVQIGNQGWMAENLAWLPSVSKSSTYSTVNKNYYVYEYEGTNVAAAKATNNYNTYGVLYNWPAAMDGAVTSNAVPSGVRGACPAGWHIPCEREWNALNTFLTINGYGFGGSGDDVGKSLAAKTNWKSTFETNVPGKDPDTNNSTGFSGLPGGRAANNYFDDLTYYGRWWSSTESEPKSGWYSILGWDEPSLNIGGGSGKDIGLSIRCVRD